MPADLATRHCFSVVAAFLVLAIVLFNSSSTAVAAQPTPVAKKTVSENAVAKKRIAATPVVHRRYYPHHYPHAYPRHYYHHGYHYHGGYARRYGYYPYYRSYYYRPWYQVPYVYYRSYIPRSTAYRLPYYWHGYFPALDGYHDYFGHRYFDRDDRYSDSVEESPSSPRSSYAGCYYW